MFVKLAFQISDQISFYTDDLFDFLLLIREQTFLLIKGCLLCSHLCIFLIELLLLGGDERFLFLQVSPGRSDERFLLLQLRLLFCEQGAFFIQIRLLGGKQCALLIKGCLLCVDLAFPFGKLFLQLCLCLADVQPAPRAFRGNFSALP